MLQKLGIFFAILVFCFGWTRVAEAAYTISYVPSGHEEVIYGDLIHAGSRIGYIAACSYNPTSGEWELFGWATDSFMSNAANALAIYGNEEANVIYPVESRSGPCHYGISHYYIDPWYSSWSGYIRIDGGEGNDEIYGSPKNDELFGDAGEDGIWGGEGNDAIDGDTGNDNPLNGEGGDDIIYGYSGNDVINGGTGNDVLLGEGDDDTINGGEGNDVILGGLGEDDLIGYKDNDEIWVGNYLNYTDPSPNYVDGGAGNDTVYGGAGVDTILGQSGNDIIHSYGGRDVILGGPDNDQIWGGDEVGEGDTIEGGTGYDRIYGEEGNDVIYGDTVSSPTTGTYDDIYGGEGNDTIYGGVGDDYIYGDEGDDYIEGGENAGNIEKLYGGAGNDEIHGGDDEDWVAGGAGNDILYGDDGPDQVEGDAGNDRIVGGPGNDYLFGGTATGWHGADSGLTNSGRDIIIGDEMFQRCDRCSSTCSTPSLYACDTTMGGGACDPYDSSYNSSGGADVIYTGDIDSENCGNITAGSTIEFDNFVVGGLGSDTIYGGNCNDWIVGDDVQDWSEGQTDVYLELSELDFPQFCSVAGCTGETQTVPFSCAGTDYLDVRILNYPYWYCDDSREVYVDTVPPINSSWGQMRAHYFGDADVIDGGAGDDVIFGCGGDDSALDGGTGNDQIEGGCGDDVMDGEGGEDLLVGSALRASCDAGYTDATCSRSDSNDISGGADDDVLFPARLDGCSTPGSVSGIVNDDDGDGGLGNDLATPTYAGSSAWYTIVNHENYIGSGVGVWDWGQDHQASGFYCNFEEDDWRTAYDSP